MNPRLCGSKPAVTAVAEASSPAPAQTAPTTLELNTEARHPFGFVGLEQLRTLVPLSERTIRTAIKRGYIPAIRLPGARRLLFDPAAVQAALQRFSRGGRKA